MINLTKVEEKRELNYKKINTEVTQKIVNHCTEEKRYFVDVYFPKALYEMGARIMHALECDYDWEQGSNRMVCIDAYQCKGNEIKLVIEEK